MQCSAKSKQSGERCKRDAAPGRNVCNIHGGATPRGVAAPRFIHGRYSVSLPTRLAARYTEAQHDPRLLELHEEIALVDTRLADLLSRVDTGESGALWRQLMTARADLMAARRAGDFTGQADALNRVLSLIEQGHADYRAWAEVGAVIEQRRRLVESERKRMVEAGLMVTAEQAFALMGAVMQAVKEHVHDPKQLANISRAIDALAAAEGSD